MTVFFFFSLIQIRGVIAQVIFGTINIRQAWQQRGKLSTEGCRNMHVNVIRYL